MLIKFVKDNHGRRVGCLVGTKEGIGWSKVHSWMDEFDREKAISIAKGRAKRGYCIEILGRTGKATAQYGEKHTVQVATAITKELPSFARRCNAYFHKAKATD
jgi:hypothetical protein